jgi:hypothetical protein
MDAKSSGYALVYFSFARSTSNGNNESASVLQYQCRIVNSTDNRVYIANESQLKEMSEAETYDSTPKINKAPWAAIKDVLLKFIVSYPVDPKLREH